MKNKKGYEIGVAFLAIGFIILLLTASYSLKSKIGGQTAIGTIQSKLINTYDQGEEIQYFIDNAAKYAADDAIKELSENGGIFQENCGRYFGSYLLVNNSKNCIPKDIENNLKLIYKKYLADYFQIYPYYINTDYSIDIKTDNQKTIINGKSDEKIILPVSGNEIISLKKPSTFIHSSGLISPIKKLDIKCFSNDVIVNSCFGYRGENTGGSSNHPGIDILVPKNTKIYSVASGKVIETDNRWGRVLVDIGNNLVVEYLHLDSMVVNKNDIVRQGQQIGFSGGRGKNKDGTYSADAYPFHLHFGIRYVGIDSNKKDSQGDSIVLSSFGEKDYINPLCFYDISEFKIDASSISCGSCHETNSCEIYQGPAKWCELYGISELFNENAQIKDEKVKIDTSIEKKAISEQTKLNNPLASCINPDFNLIEKTKVKDCYQYYDIIKKEIDKLDMDFDPLFIMSWAQSESSCSPNTKNNQGLMQVEGCKNCHSPASPNIEAQFEEGFIVYKNMKKYVDTKDLSYEDAAIITLFSYNRGNKYGNIAVKKYKEGFPLEEAMDIACRESPYSCDRYGEGATYYRRILDIYEDSCRKMNGELVTKDYSSQTKLFESFGDYLFTPSFRINIDFDMGVFNKIYEKINKLNEKYKITKNKQEFIENIFNELNNFGDNLNWYKDCDDEENKLFYSFTEQFYLCLNSSDNDCYCEIHLPDELKESSEFLIENEKFSIIFLKGLLKEIFEKASIFKYDKKDGVLLIIKDSVPINFNQENNLYKIKLGDDYIYENIKKNESFYLYKLSSDKISFIHPDNYKNIKSNIIPENVCRKQDDTVKFCVDTGQTITAYNSKTNLIEKKKNIIKFAYKFRDMMPPDAVETFESFSDYTLFNKELLLIFSHNDIDDDTVKFKIYFSDKDFRDKNIEYIKNSPDINRKEFLINDIIQIDEIDLTKPSADIMRGMDWKISALTYYYKVNAYDNQQNIIQNQILPKENKLYGFKKEKNEKGLIRYFTNIKLETYDEYFILVTSLDKNNNENIEFTSDNYITIEPKDNLPPATRLLDGFDFDVEKQEDGKITVSWNSKPTKNIDGSDFAEDELLEYNIFYKEDDMQLDYVLDDSNKNIVDRNSFGAAYDLKKEKDYCVYVIPVDNNGNKQFSSKTLDQLGRDVLEEIFSPVCTS